MSTTGWFDPSVPRETRIARGAGVLLWAMAAMVVLELLLLAGNLLGLLTTGAPNQGWGDGADIPPGTERTELEWRGQLTLLAPWWLVLLQGLVLAVGTVLVIPRAHRRVEFVGRHVLLVANLPYFGAIAALLALYTWQASRFDAVDGVGPYAVPLALAIVVAIAGFGISAVELVLRFRRTASEQDAAARPPRPDQRGAR